MCVNLALLFFLLVKGSLTDYTEKLWTMFCLPSSLCPRESNSPGVELNRKFFSFYKKVSDEEKEFHILPKARVGFLTGAFI